MNRSLLILLLIVFFKITGCTTVVDVATSKPIEVSSEKRSLGTYIDDKTLQVIVGVNIRKADPVLKQSNIQVTSYNSVVLLTGQVPTQDMRLLAAKVAADTNSVRQVHNELQVVGNTALLTRTSDTWLATKIKAILITDPEIKGVTIKVVVEDGVAYLMGKATQE
ncbi:MAG: osmotically-inducible protein OsmY, partial [Cellvibrionaceae bacterium]